MSLSASASAIFTLLDRSAVTTESPLEEIFLARQPILDVDNLLVGYELLFRASHTNQAEVTSNMQATSTVLENTLSGFGLNSVLGTADGYLNVDEAFLNSELIDLLPPEKIVLELMGTVQPEAVLLERLRELRTKGFRVAIDAGPLSNERVLRMAPRIDVVKVDMSTHNQTALVHALTKMPGNSIIFLAEKVETTDQFQMAKGLGFKLFQGYHFAKPQMLVAKVHRRPEKVQLLKLLNLILVDANISELETELKRHPILSINLLRLVNSAAMGRKIQITSVRHALAMAGRQQLRNWLQLMIYTGRADEDSSRNPLLQMAASRAKLMELIMRRYDNATDEAVEAAFMTGMLSLVDVLVNMPREQVVAELALSPEIKAALLDGEGRLGYLLKVAQLVEEADDAALRVLIGELPVNGLDGLFLLEVEAFSWANAISAS